MLLMLLYRLFEAYFYLVAFSKQANQLIINLSFKRIPIFYLAEM